MNQADLINTDQSWFDIPPVQPGRNQARKVQNASGEIAFFKAPQPHVLGNEVLSWAVSDRLALPCAKVQFATLPDSNGNPQSGILSFRVQGVELVEWPLVPGEIRQNMQRYVMNYGDISKIAIYDIWTYNNDRHAANLIISRKTEWKKKYLVYIIDHEECFYGYAPICNRSEQDALWNSPGGFISVPEIKNTIKFSEIESFISEIEGINDEELKQLIDLIPDRYYNANQADAVFDILRKRRDKLRALVRDWCQTEGKL
jgi:hypothetical protein